MNLEKGRYRVLLIGIEDNTNAGKESFCYNICENFKISFPILKKIVNSCPIILKKNLPLEKATALAKTLKSFGAIVSVEEKRDVTKIFLEFDGIEPLKVVLESSSLRKTESGVWNVIGRVKNISEESLKGTWVLIQLFDDLEEFLTFDEIPLPINPLPPKESSPFKVVFEGNLPIKKISIAFKDSSGHPISATDRRKKEDWIKAEIGGEDEYITPSPLLSFPSPDKEDSLSVNISGLSEEISNDHFSETQKEYSQPFEIGTPSLSIEEGLHETVPEPMEGSGESGLGVEQGESEKVESEGTLRKEEPTQSLTLSPSEEREEKERTILLEWKSHTDHPQDTETPSHASILEETMPSQKDTSGKGEEKTPPSPISWMEAFRNSINTYYQKPRGIFSAWFRAEREGEGFINSFHSLLTILLYARFDQMNHSEKALGNVQRVFQLSIYPDLQLEQIPPLEGTAFFSAEDWRVLFYRAIPKLREVSNIILEKGQWEALDLERLVQVIPHMSPKNSQMAVRWFHELIPDVIPIDFSHHLISVEESLYRVASRLGVVDPDCDFYQGENSIGDLKIQSFGKMVFPQDPLKIEEPMKWVGRKEEGGHCFPTQPRCTGCLFGDFCPKLHSNFNPSEKGMQQDQ